MFLNRFRSEVSRSSSKTKGNRSEGVKGDCRSSRSKEKQQQQQQQPIDVEEELYNVF